MGRKSSISVANLGQTRSRRPQPARDEPLFAWLMRKGMLVDRDSVPGDAGRMPSPIHPPVLLLGVKAMNIGLLGCWSNMRIYPVYSTSLRKALATLTGKDVAVVTTDCMCFEKSDPVDDDYDYINLPYLARGASKSRLRAQVKQQLYPVLEATRGCLLSFRSSHFDVVDFQQSSYAFGYESLKSFLSVPSKAKKIVTLHKLDQIQKDHPELNKVYNKADGVIVFSDYMKHMLVGYGVEPDKVHVIYHGTSLPPLRDVPKEQAILFCGSPIPQIKGFEHFVVALRLLGEQGLRLRVKVYGFFLKDEKDYAIGLARDEGVDLQLEWQSFKNEDELVAEHQRSSVCLIPYTGYAGYFPAAYSMGNAVPVVATDILGHGEYLDGSGILVPPASPEELAGAVKRILDDQAFAKELGAHGRKRAEETLSWETVAKQTLEVFRKALNA